MMIEPLDFTLSQKDRICMKLLVTGGAGFIGSNLIHRLLESGHEVTALDDLSTGNPKNISKFSKNTNFKFINGSILDETLVNTLVSKTERVFHLAAAVGVFNIVQDPIGSFTTNVNGTHNLLEACRAKQVPIFFTSSSEIYGKNSEKALHEYDDRIIGSPQISRWSYSEAKAIDEFLITEYHRKFQLETRRVRLFNTVGPGQVGCSVMVLQSFIQRALKNEPIQIYGDGNQTRCFTHVEDVIDALLLVDSTPSTIGEVFNIGNNIEISILDLAERVIKYCDSNSLIEFIDYNDAYSKNFEDMRRRVPDTSKICALLGWKATHSLEKIIADIVLYESEAL